MLWYEIRSGDFDVEFLRLEHPNCFKSMHKAYKKIIAVLLLLISSVVQAHSWRKILARIQSYRVSVLPRVNLLREIGSEWTPKENQSST